MRLLLIRHADAGDQDPTRWPDDSQRPISPRGERRHRKVAKRLRKMDLVPTLLLTSPWRRAWQTAELMARELDCPAPVATDALAAPPTLARISGAIGQRADDAIVALVGHEPWLGELAARLLAGRADALAIDFPKSGVLGLEVDTLAAGTAVLDFFLRPKGG